MWKLAKQTDLSAEQIQKLRHADFSFGFRPVAVEIDTVHSTGKVSMRSVRDLAVAEAKVTPTQRLRAHVLDLPEAA